MIVSFREKRSMRLAKFSMEVKITSFFDKK